MPVFWIISIDGPISLRSAVFAPIIAYMRELVCKLSQPFLVLHALVLHALVVWSGLVWSLCVPNDERELRFKLSTIPPPIRSRSALCIPQHAFWESTNAPNTLVLYVYPRPPHDCARYFSCFALCIPSKHPKIRSYARILSCSIPSGSFCPLHYEPRYWNSISVSTRSVGERLK